MEAGLIAVTGNEFSDAVLFSNYIQAFGFKISQAKGGKINLTVEVETFLNLSFWTISL